MKSSYKRVFLLSKLTNKFHKLHYKVLYVYVAVRNRQTHAIYNTFLEMDTRDRNVALHEIS